MTSDPIGPGTPPRTPSEPSATPPEAYPGQPLESLARYFEVNGRHFTDEALGDAARRAGYSDEEIEGAIRARTTSAPIRQRARRYVIAAYLLTYAGLVAGMAVTPSTHPADFQVMMLTSVIGIIVLTAALGVAFAISLALVGGARARSGTELALAGVLAVPVILLVVVAGVCVASGLPIPRFAYDAGLGSAPIDGGLAQVHAET